MSDKNLQLELQRISHLFIPHQIGQGKDGWIVRGTLTSTATLEEVKQMVQNMSIEVFEQNGDITLLMNEKNESILFSIPAISKAHIFLFLATIGTTLLAGALMAGGDPFSSFSELWRGLPFSMTLMLILGCHETGHYVYAQKHGVDATLPYFIPAPTFIGTFGAFIKIKSPIQKRKALLDIGASGPIAGFLVAVPALIWGLLHSEVLTVSGEQLGMKLGDSILMKILTALIFPNLSASQDVVLHPVAFAGWIGLLVTMLNLLPIGQLDGGHIAYALLGRKFDKLAKFVWLMLIPMAFISINWLIWGILIMVLMRTTKHPPVADIDRPLTKEEKRIGFVSLAIFILCFIPAPFPS
ncbi:MAG: site-2 protease family protein [Candidatus Marinimicrobia bacterium]|jgi:membrane-associated protease RseP (regulator of RpoE activity)|nr:site-2 protease family protein [Candidatus Neomarinimicrobiota bacterium]MBT3497006.1 site-2 protease family protein [Candidatus Neomarinimicrobiota bacterium]MBT3692593.1 site-2 protease family protein [Candidatus Neomarinimicrobiota bacterium]MBT3732437.1 site-2 protease family protein [Candidatus Neomarinimicrobiota bacterium]MBT4144689.1 site-2 protease family protein [Candidatus Neomarinimicrobiota bacterium]